MNFADNIVKKPLVSVIITYYNLAKFIEDCVFSILNQSYQEFEIIIVNDNSSKKNSEILNKIKNSKIKIINSSKTEGQLASFLKGLEVAKGEFICMVDGDDVLLSNHIQTLLYIHLNHNYALVSSSGGEINEKNEIISLNYSTNKFKQKLKDIVYLEIENLFKQRESFKIKEVKDPFGCWSWNSSTSCMIRKSALDILKYYNDIRYWKTGADKVVFSFADLIGSSCNIEAVTYLYRHHKKNHSKTLLTTGKERILSEEYILKLIDWNKKIRLDAFKIFKENQDQLIEKYNKIKYLKMFFRIIFCVNYKICAKIIKTFAHKLIKF